jgi:hypothetical protein
MMLSMAADVTFSMALRTGNWGRSGIMLPYHKPLKVRLAPSDAANGVVTFGAGLTAVPRVLTFDEVDSVRVSDAAGRAVLRLDGPGGRVARGRSQPLLSPGAWELRLEGEKGVLVLYARDDEPVPSDEVLDELAARFGTTSPVE